MVLAGLSLEVVLEGSSLKVIGTQVILSNGSTGEIRSRIAGGWSSLYSLKALLLNRRISIRRRLKLFEATVGSTVLWCAESWARKVEDKHTLKASFHAMLQEIVGSRRGADENYVDWVIRSTRAARELAKTAGVRSWLETHGIMKWCWAGHVARQGPHE